MFETKNNYGLRGEPKKFSRIFSKRIAFFGLIFLVTLAASFVTIALNDVSVSGIVNFKLLTADTAAPTTILASGGGQVTTLNVRSNYIDITLDNSSSVTFNTTAPSEFFRITHQSGSSDYTISPSCPTTTVTLTGTGATAVLRLMVYTVDICPAGGGGTSHVFPLDYSISINNGATTTTTRGVTLNLTSQNAVQVVVSNNQNFIGAEWESFSGPENRSWTLTSGDGTKTVYVIYKSITGDLSPIISDSIEIVSTPVVPVPPIEEAPPTPPTKEVPPTSPLPSAGCVVDCQKVTDDLYIVNPNGTVRSEIGSYAKRTNLGNNTELIAFEDSGSDMDFNDVIVKVDHSDCEKITAKVTQLNAAWHHEIKIKLYYDGVPKEDVMVYPDSHLALSDAGKTINLSDHTSLCQEVKDYVTVYEHINYRGRSQTYYLGEDIPDLRNSTIGDNVISSIKVHGGAALQAFSSYDYRGGMEIFSANDPDLRNNPIGQDTISSLKVIRNTGGIPTAVATCKPGIKFTAFMRLGTASNQVRELQKLLKCLGYEINVSGYFDKVTEAAVKKFQSDHGVKPDGFVGSATRDVLNSL